MNEQRTVDFRFILGVFLKYCWLIVGVALAAGILTFGISKFVLKKKYRSVASVCVMPNTIVKETSKDLRAMPGETTSSMDMGATYQDFMVINQLINDINVMVSSRNLTNQVVDQLSRDEKAPLTLEDLKNAQFSVKPTLVRQTRIVELEAQALDREIATRGANAMTEVLQDFLRDKYGMHQVNVLDVAVDAKAPFRPRVLLNTIIGIILGGGACYALCFLKETFQGTVDTPDMVTDCLKVPVVGTITQLNEEISNSRSSSTRTNNIVTIEVDGKTPRFDVAESFRLLRTNLQYAIGRKEGARVFVMTSTSPKDGKTFIASNVATIVASSGIRVLLINCDLRKPALHKVFNLEKNTGLVNILVGEADFDTVINRNVLGLSLDVLASGPVPPNPSELLMSPAFQQLLDSKRNEYDYIILDAPPCLNISDAAIVGKMSDGILYVVSATKTRLDDAAHAISQLRSLDIPVVGCILNRFSPKSWSSYGYGGYGYGYGYKYYSYNDYSEYSKPDVDEPNKKDS